MSPSRSVTRSLSRSRSLSRTPSPPPQPHPSSSPKSHRQTTTPFLLHLFYRPNAYNHLTSFPLPTPSNPNPPLPRHHLQIYTWMSCTLRELAMLLVGAVPDLIYEDEDASNKNGESSGVEKKRKLVVGTRLGFRLVYPDLHSTSSHQHSNNGQGRLTDTENRGRYMCREMGSVVVGAPSQHDNIIDTNGNSFIEDKRRNYELESEDADKTLEQLRFVIGDYVDVAVFAPLSDGSVVSRSLAMGSANTGNGPRRDMNGYSSRGGRGGSSGGGYSGGYGRGRGGEGLPSGEWRRGERLPDRGGYGAGGGGGGGAGYSSGGGYTRGRGPY